jgi:6-phosphogluconolactonase
MALALLGCGGTSSPTTSSGPSPGAYLWQVSDINSVIYTSTLNSSTGQVGSPVNSGGFACNGIGSNVSTIAVAPSRKFLFVLDLCVERVHVYSMSGPGIKLTEVAGSPFYQTVVIGSSSESPASLSIDESGQSLYEVLSPQEIVQWDIDSSTGALTDVSHIIEPANTSLFQGIIDPSGRFLFAADGENRIFAYVIGSGGALSSISGSPFTIPSGGNPTYIEATGKFLYALLYGGGVAAFTIDNSTGALVSVPGSPFPTTYFLTSGLAIDPVGKFLYVTEADALTDGFTIDANSGALAAITGSPFATGLAASSLVTDSSGQFLYFPDESNSTVIGYKIDPSTGSLLTLAGSPFPAAPSPLQIINLTIP